MSTFTQMRARAAVRFGDPGNAVITDTVWKDYVNEGYRWLQRQHPRWPFLRATATVAVTSGARSGTLATRVWQVVGAYNATDDRTMALLTTRLRRTSTFMSTETGAPTHYRVRGGTLEVFPKPTQNTNITVEYFGNATDLSSDADVPVPPDKYHDIIVAKAVALAYRDDGNDIAADYEAEVATSVETMIADLVRDPMLQSDPELTDVHNEHVPPAP